MTKSEIYLLCLFFTLRSNGLRCLIIRAHQRQMSTKQIDLIHRPNLVHSLYLN